MGFFTINIKNLWKRYSHINLALADQVLVSGVNFLTGILLARYLGMYEFGVFTLAWLAVDFVNSLQGASIISPMMSVGPKQSRKDEPAYFGSLMTQELIMAFTSFIVILFGTWASGYIFPHWRITDLALPLASAAFAFQMQDYVRRYFFTRKRISVAFGVDIICFGGRLVLLLCLIYLGMMSVDNVFWIITVSCLICSLFGYLKMEKFEWPDLSFFKSTCLRHWRFSKWLVASEVMKWISDSMFSIAAGVIVGPSAAGALKASQNIMGITHIMFFALNNIAVVKASKIIVSEGQKALAVYLRKVALFVGGTTFLFAAVASLAAEFLLVTLYGSEYGQFVWVMRGFAIVYLFIALKLPFEIGLKALEYTKPVFWSSVLTTIFSVMAASAMVGWLGIYGAVLGLIFLEVTKYLVLKYGYSLAKKLEPLHKTV